MHSLFTFGQPHIQKELVTKSLSVKFHKFQVLEVKDAGTMILERGVNKDIILIPGREFTVDSSKSSQFLRAAFSCATPEQMMKVWHEMYSTVVLSSLPPHGMT